MNLLEAKQAVLNYFVKNKNQIFEDHKFWKEMSNAVKKASKKAQKDIITQKEIENSRKQYFNTLGETQIKYLSINEINHYLMFLTDQMKKYNLIP